MQKRMKQVGVGWKKASQEGKPFMSVVINDGLRPDIHLMIWPNGFKEKDEQPDYIVYLADPAVPKPEAKQESKPASEFPDDDQDVPF